MVSVAIVQHHARHYYIAIALYRIIYNAAAKGLEGGQSPAISSAFAPDRFLQRLHEEQALLLVQAEDATSPRPRREISAM